MTETKVETPSQRRQRADAHKVHCGICASPIAQEVDYRILMGEKNADITRYMTEMGKSIPNWKTWKTHRELVQELAAPAVHQRIREEAKKKNEGGTVPIEKLETQFLAGLIGDAMPEVVTTIAERIRSDDEEEKPTFGQLLQFLEMAVKVSQLMLGQPTERREDISKAKATVTLADVLGNKSPEEKAAAMADIRKLGDALEGAKKTMENEISKSSNN